MTARLAPIEWAAVSGLMVLAGIVGILAGARPEMAIAASLGIVFVSVVLADLSAGFAAFVFLTFIALIPAITGPVASIVKAAGLILALAWLARMSTQKSTEADFFRAHPGLAYTVILLLAWVALSQTWAADTGEARVAFTRMGLNAVLFVIAYAAIASQPHVTKVLGAFLLGAVFSTIYGFAQPPDPAAADRLAGTFGNPNQLAATLVVGSALGFGLAAPASRTPMLRFLAFTAASLCLVGLMLTLSRGGLVGGLSALLAAIVFGGRWRPHIAAVVSLILITAFGLYSTAISPESRERLLRSDSGTGRVDLWTVGVRMIEDRPVIGIGASNFPTSSVEYLLEPGQLTRTDFIVSDPKVAHNMYLEVFAELGIVGLTLFLAMIIACIALILRAISTFARQSRKELEAMARSVLVALLGLLAAYAFQSGQLEKTLWLLLALCPAFYGLSRRPSMEDPPRSGSEPRAAVR